MQRSALFTAALLTAAAAFSSACNDLGDCDDPKKGRTTVVNAGGELMFTGQAAINATCASCHSSLSKGGARKGAPAGLDFDLFPIADGTPITGANGAVAGLKLDPAKLSGLRSRQRKVYEVRELIWEQVDKGLMPPKGSPKTLSQFVKSVFGSDGACMRSEALKDLDVNREELRNWLACSTPIIEATSSALPKKEFDPKATEADKAAGTAFYSTTESTGYQYPSCGGGAPMPGAGVGFEDVYNTVFAKSSNLCLACHSGAGAMGNFDIGTIDKAYQTLLGASGQGGTATCPTKPVYVKPNEPQNSYLLTMVVASATGRCTPNVMPLSDGKGLDAAGVELITKWIMGGALRTASAAGTGDAGMSGADAGAADAGDAGR